MSIKIKNLDKVLAELNRTKDAIVDAAKDTLEVAATNIEIDATKNAPTSYQIGDASINLSFIKQKINKKGSNKGLLWKVGLSVPATGDQWEAWMEFGTGLSAEQILKNPNYTNEIRLQAQNFYRNGKGRIIGKPYLYPAFFKNTDNLVTDMVNEIKNAIK